MNNTIYIASRCKNGGLYRLEFLQGHGYVNRGITIMDSPMYMIKSGEKMHILLRSPFCNNESGYLSYDIMPNGDLHLPTDIVSTKGEIACHLTTFKDHIYCVNYTSGDVTKIGKKTVNHNGKGLPDSHPHYVGPTPDGKYLLVTDLGQDYIYIYDDDLNCVNMVKMPQGHGVRHLVISSDGKYIYSANELKSTVSVLKYNDGNLEIVDTKSCLPEEFVGVSSASAIRIYNGDIYVANRGHNSISKMAFDGQKLEFLDCFSCNGDTPRDFIFHRNRIICANQNSDSVTVFEEDDNGAFRFIQKIDIVEPICVICGNQEG